MSSPSEGHPECGVPGRMQASTGLSLFKPSPQLLFCTFLMKTQQATLYPWVSTEGPRCPVSTGRSHGNSGSGAMGHRMLAGLAASSTPPNVHTYTRPERESCLCVPQVGDRPGSHDINPPLGPSPARSKVLESVVEPDLHPHTLGTQASSS